MSTWPVFAYGCLGALVAYIYTERNRKLQELVELVATKRGKKNRRRRIFMILFNILLYLLPGGFIAAYVVQPQVTSGAVVAGLGWERIVDTIIPQRRLQEAPTEEKEEGLNDKI